VTKLLKLKKLNFCFFAILIIANSFQISSLCTVSERDSRVTISDCTLTMSSDINDINDIVNSAREIVQDGYIKNRFPQLSDVLFSLIEKYENSSLNESERYTLMCLTVLFQNNQNLQ
jgi:hypothetical protein